MTSSTWGGPHGPHTSDQTVQGSRLCLLCTASVVAAAPGAEDHVARPAESTAHESSLIARWTFEQFGPARPFRTTAGRGHDNRLAGQLRSRCLLRAFRSRLASDGPAPTGHSFRAVAGKPAPDLVQCVGDADGFERLSGDLPQGRRRRSRVVLVPEQRHDPVPWLEHRGYVECDGRSTRHRCWTGCGTIVPPRLTAARCASIWTGSRSVHLERAGTVTIRRGSAGFRGSMAGSSEYFQGALDDLRILPRGPHRG